jgi:hypothetical protein
MRTRAAAAAAGAACLVAAAPAAAKPAAPAAADPATEAAKLAKARERWAAQDAVNYRYRLRVACFCPPRGPVTIRVRGGRPRGTPDSLRRFDTVEKLFARIREELDRGGKGLHARYGVRGIPKDFSADPFPDAVDDEYTVIVRRLRITTRQG